MVGNGTLINGLSVSRALTTVAVFSAKARRALSKGAVLQEMVNDIANALRADRVAYYKLEAGLLHIEKANRPELIEQSHVKGIVPEGPLAIALEKEGFVFVPNILQPDFYWILDNAGNFFRADGNPMNTKVTQAYIEQYGKSFQGNHIEMGIVYGCLSVPGQKFGAFKADSFPSGRSVLPSGMKPEDLLNIVAIVSNAASQSLAEFQQRKELEEQWVKMHNLLMGAAHAFTGRLTIIKGWLGLALSGKDFKGIDPLKIAEEKIAVVAEYIRRYLEQTKKGDFGVPVNSVPADIKIILEELKTLDYEVEVDEALPIITTDVNKVKDVLFELIENAKKFSPGGSPVKIICRKTGEKIEVSVIDKGLGMRKEQIEKIFDGGIRFYQDIQGNGYGLHGIKKIIEKLGGGIFAESEGLGKGSTFRFTLPINNSPAPLSS